MNPWKAKLFLDALDERIVPDATPIVTFADAHTSGAVVAAYDNGGSGSGVVTYADRHTSGAVVAAYDNGYTSGSWVSTYSSGAGGGQQQEQIPSRDDIRVAA